MPLPTEHDKPGVGPDVARLAACIRPRRAGARAPKTLPRRTAGFGRNHLSDRSPLQVRTELLKRVDSNPVGSRLITGSWRAREHDSMPRNDSGGDAAPCLGCCLIHLSYAAFSAGECLSASICLLAFGISE